MKKITLCILLLIIVFQLVSCGRNIDTEKGLSWKSPLGSIYNTNSSLYAPKHPYSVTWEQNLGKTTKCAPVSAGGVTIVADDEGSVYCLDNEDGQKIWTRQFIGGISIQPVISNGKVLFSDGSSTFYAISISNGSQIWQQDIPSPIVGWALVDSGKIYVATTNSLVCFEETKGTQIFRKDFIEKVSASPSLMRYIYLPCGNHLYALDSNNGDVMWKIQFERPIIGTVACTANYLLVVDGNLNIVNDYDGKIISKDEKETISASNGKKLEYWYCTPASVYLNLILCPSVKPTIVGYQSSPLKKVWSFGTMKPLSLPPFISGNQVIFASDSRLYVCDTATGAWKWHYNYDENIVGICPVGINLDEKISSEGPKMCIITSGEKGKIARFDVGGKPLTKEEIKQLPQDVEQMRQKYEEELRKKKNP
jgi:outer membrane protein assembly factor BamB